MSRDLDMREIARVNRIMAHPNAVFVFGSNRTGIHGGGAAKTAHREYGIPWHFGEGMRGRAYALPTKDDHIRSLPMHAVAEHVRTFLDFARSRPDLTFAVTRVGCGLAGFTDEQIAPLFLHAPSNCELPEGWR